MESKLGAHQEYIQRLEASLQEEMSRHAPLYGAGLEILTLHELDTLARIHDEGLRQISQLKQQRQDAGEVRAPSLKNQDDTHLAGTANGDIGGLANGVGPMHRNGHANGGVAEPWYPSA